MPLQSVFVPELTWATQPGIVAVGSTAEYSVSLNESGRLTRIVRREIDPIPASREQAISHIGDGSPIEIRNSCFIDQGNMVDKRGYAETIPLIGTVFLSPSGDLWVQRFTFTSGLTARWACGSSRNG